MFPSFRRLLLGDPRCTPRSLRWAFLAIGLFACTFAAYAVDVFGVSGGVVFVPGDAAVVGLVAAAWLGYARDGLLAAWLAAAAAMLGYRADHAFLGLSGRTLAEQAAYFAQVDGLFVLTLMGVVVGSLAFPVGRAVRRAVDEVAASGTGRVN
jgi:hypothetical protein